MYLFRTLLIMIIAAPALACLASDRYQEYIEKYSPIAVEHQTAYGIPASITLAQGLLESAAGRSTLATKGNNHFGIKCHSTWTGDTLLRNDDAPNECFRAYASAEESFADHSRFLKGKRYAPLFELEATDYAGWAKGLRQCGYATDPNYASRLITIIERYALYLYDTEAGRKAEEDVDYIHQHLRATHPIRRSRGLHYVIASPGDTYSSIARELGLDKKKLFSYNDVQKDGEIKPWEEVYLEPKLTDAPAGSSTATIGDGESLHSLSQRFGIRLERLKELNPGVADRPGSVIKLR